MVRFLVIAGLLLSGSISQAADAISSCRLIINEYSHVVGTISVARNEDTNERILDGRLAFSGVLLEDGVCTSRHCVFKTTDVIYTLTPRFLKNSDVIKSMNLKMRSSIMVSDDYLSACKAEKELPEDIY
ncbi:MAG: hypothetical protein ACK5P7_13080 [Bdellovibrio sp.]